MINELMNIAQGALIILCYLAITKEIRQLKRELYDQLNSVEWFTQEQAEKVIKTLKPSGEVEKRQAKEVREDGVMYF